MLWVMPSAQAKLNVDTLSRKDIVIVDSFLAKKAPLIKKRAAEGTLPVLSFAEVQDGLDDKEKQLVAEILQLKPEDLDVKTPFQGLSSEELKFDKIENQKIKVKDKIIKIMPQFIHPKERLAYEAMMRHMEQDLGKRLYIRSGFRSSAYQLYSFIFYLREHKYSLRETAKLNALPGYSEHGKPGYHAIDFINQDGIDDDSDPEIFAKLPEYEWLLKHARAYGFVLSYPAGNPYGISFEPWHWKFIGMSPAKKK